MKKDKKSERLVGYLGLGSRAGLSMMRYYAYLDYKLAQERSRQNPVEKSSLFGAAGQRSFFKQDLQSRLRVVLPPLAMKAVWLMRR